MAGTSLIIVESPAKARTIQKFLGSGFRVKASMGHVRDLPKNPKKKGDPDWIGVDESHDFQPHYTVLRDKKKIVDEIVSAAEGAKAILLAADPDREGEAICWHLAEIFAAKKIKVPVQRVLFHEITRRAVRGALEEPRAIAVPKVQAQQARRILDRIVGYRVSPLLWEKVRRGLSAGRVQTVALRMIIEREREIAGFVPVEHWTVTTRLQAREGPAAGQPFAARVIAWGERSVPWQKGPGGVREPGLANEASAAAAVAAIEAQPLRVAEVEAKRTRRSPPPPFTTSKLQQEAARRFHLPVRMTMRIAQALYEGKDLEALGRVGLITYMRTDSVRVAQEAQTAARERIAATYGEDYLPAKPRAFRQRKSVQDAHEAIRPTSLDLPPEKVAGYLNAQERKLYTLIWNRFLASQMAAAEYDVTRVEIEAGEARLQASGQVLRFPGWRTLYQEAREEGDTNGAAETTEGDLPPLRAADALETLEVRPEQNFTQPPSRYSEAMLVRALEENGIGRPSTYAAILTVLSDKDYVAKLEGRFHPTRLGELVTDLLVEHFGDIFAVAYTAQLEAQLDRVEEGTADWVTTLRTFADKFRQDLERARREMENVKARQEKTDIPCELCGAMMVKRWGRFGEFLACERYPECRHTRDLEQQADATAEIKETCPTCGKPMTMRRGRWGVFLACTGYPECRTTRRIEVSNGTVEVKRDEVLEETCPECQRPLARKHGRYGEYIGCTGYPECRYIKRQETGVACPQEGCPGRLVEKRTRTGRRFYGCSEYPQCKFAVWDPPVARPCPQCGFALLVARETKRDGRHDACPSCKAKVPPQEETVDGNGPSS